MLALGDARAAESTLVYGPLVHRDVLAAWPGPRVAFYDGHARTERLEREHPKARLWCAGSVLHPAVDLAVRMGAARVVLLGADFAHLGGRSHAAGATWERPAPARGPRPWVLDGHGARVPSLPNLIGYLRDLERFVARHPHVRFVSASRDGARVAGARFLEEELDARS
jgi:hypothetical protein